MPPSDRNESIRTPLLQALMDDDPESTSDPRLSPKAQAKRIRESVRDDIQQLLNTRERCVSWPKELSELRRSVLAYGVPDVTGANLASTEKRATFLEGLADALRRQEPRLQRLKLSSLENSDPLDRTLRFRLEAAVRVEAGPEAAVFDFQLEPVTQHFE